MVGAYYPTRKETIKDQSKVFRMMHRKNMYAEYSVIIQSSIVLKLMFFAIMVGLPFSSMQQFIYIVLEF
jgi:hypothetical protein